MFMLLHPHRASMCIYIYTYIYVYTYIESMTQCLWHLDAVVITFMYILIYPYMYIYTYIYVCNLRLSSV